MDRKSLIAAALCILFYLGWTQYLQTKYPDYGKPPQKPATSGSESKGPSTQLPLSNTDTDTEINSDVEAEKNGSSESITEAAPNGDRLGEEELTIENELVRYQFDQDRSGLIAATLKKYKASPEKDNTDRVELINSLLTIQAFPTSGDSPIVSNYSAKRNGESIEFLRQQGPWRIKQIYDFSGASYGGGLKIFFENTSNKHQELNASIKLREKVTLPEAKGGFLPDMVSQQSSFVVGSNGSRDEESMRKFCEDDDTAPVLTGKNVPLDFIGFDRHYFVNALVADSAKFSHAVTKSNPVGSSDICDVTMTLEQSYGMIEPGRSVELNFKTYFGPKDPDELAATSASLRETLYLGWFGVIARPLLWVVKSIFTVTGNYGLAIILLTICLKILFYPLTRAAAVSMKRMQQFTPELTRIKEKYKDDRQAQNREVMAFMAKHKINPAKGCLPILPQIPVFIAFYNVLSHAIELRHAPFFGWIQDLSAADPFYITPVLLGVGMLIQQKLTPNPTMDKTQEKVMMMMPVFFTFMMLSLPAGMVIYMITNTIVSIAQQQWLNKRLDVKLAKAPA